MLSGACNMSTACNVACCRLRLSQVRALPQQLHNVRTDVARLQQLTDELFDALSLRVTDLPKPHAIARPEVDGVGVRT